MKLDTPVKQFITLIGLALIWGSSFILMKRGLEVYSAIEVAEYRLFIAGITLLPFALIKLKAFPKGAKQRIGIVMVAVFGNLLPAFLFAIAQTKVASGVAGMLNSLVPLFTLIIGLVFFKSKIKPLQIGGVALGLVGAITLISGSNISFNVNSMLYPLLVIIASLCYAISLNTIKAWLHQVPSIQITSFAFLLIGPFVTVGLLQQGFFEKAISSNQNLVALGYLSVLGVFGTALAVLLFNVLIKYTSAIFASSVTYLIPIVAMLWGIIDGELVGVLHLFGMALILSGVYLVNFKSKIPRPD